MSSKYLPLIKEIFKSYRGMTNFSKCAGGARVLEVDEGRVKVELDITDEVINPYGTLHGGCTATLVDIVTTAALTATKRAHPGVSVDLTVSYLTAAKLGETILIDASVLRSGKTLAFTKAEIFRKTDNALIAIGQHTKAFPPIKTTP